MYLICGRASEGGLVQYVRHSDLRDRGLFEIFPTHASSRPLRELRERIVKDFRTGTNPTLPVRRLVRHGGWNGRTSGGNVVSLQIVSVFGARTSGCIIGGWLLRRRHGPKGG